MHEGPYGGHIDIRTSPLMSHHLNSSIRISPSRHKILLESKMFPQTEIGGPLDVTDIQGWDEERKVM